MNARKKNTLSQNETFLFEYYLYFHIRYIFIYGRKYKKHKN